MNEVVVVKVAQAAQHPAEQAPHHPLRQSLACAPCEHRAEIALLHVHAHYVEPAGLDEGVEVADDVRAAHSAHAQRLVDDCALRGDVRKHGRGTHELPLLAAGATHTRSNKTGAKPSRGRVARNVAHRAH